MNRKLVLWLTRFGSWILLAVDPRNTWNDERRRSGNRLVLSKKKQTIKLRPNNGQQKQTHQYKCQSLFIQTKIHHLYLEYYTGCRNRQKDITCLPNNYQCLKAIQQTRFVTTNTALILMASNPNLKSAHQADIVTIDL